MESYIPKFCEILERYLSKMTQIPPEVGAIQELGPEQPSLLGVTGLVHVGNDDYQGCVYISAGLDFFAAFAKAMNPAVQSNINLLKDTSGEMANMIAGSAQQFLGEDLRISTPMVIMGINSQLHIEQSKYLIPFQWNGRHARLLLAISKL